MKVISYDNKTNTILSKNNIDNIDKIVVGAVIINTNNEVLLLQRVKDEFMGGLVELPSGSAHNKETLLKALVREVKEETGLDIIEVKQYLSSFNYLSSSGKKTRQLSFLVNTINSNIKINKGEHSTYYWAKVGSSIYKSLNISSETRQIIDIALMAQKGNKLDI